MTKRNWSASAETMSGLKNEAAGHDRGLLSALTAEWDNGKAPDALGVLAERPELADKKSVILELAYEEFCRRQELGEQLDVDEFCSRFPHHRTSVRRRIEVHQFMQRELAPERSTVRWPTAGQDFCEFQLLEEIGQGAIGRVFLARQARLGDRTVVLKVSKGGSREANLLGRLQHQNVMPVYSVEDDAESGLTTVCMPLFGLTTFEDLLDQVASSQSRPQSAGIFRQTVCRLTRELPSLDVESWARLERMSFLNGVLLQFAQIFDALAYLHSEGICHRDLKPSNILLADDARPLLLDFNLSAELASVETRLGGTLPYMAPEQIRGMLGLAAGNTIDERADIFSMGVILFEMLTGALPFGPVSRNLSMQRGGSQLLEKQGAGPDLFKLRNAGVDRHVISIVQRCLKFEPSHRFADAAAVAQAIRAALRPVPRAKRWAKRHPILSAAIGLLIAALLTCAALLWALKKPQCELLFEEGLAAYHHGDMQAAVAAFEESKKNNPEFDRALLGVARTRQALKQYSAACNEYQRIYERTGDPRWLASMGYCMNLQGKHADAAGYYSRSLGEGYKTKVVLNNAGLSYFRIGSPAAARKYLGEALELDPYFREALYNRARVDWKQAIQSPSQMPPSTMDETEMAIQQASGFGNLHYMAACIWSRSDDPARWEAVIRHTERAVDLGHDPVRFTHGSNFTPILGDERMQRALKRPARQALASDPPEVLDPLPDFWELF